MTLMTLQEYTQEVQKFSEMLIKSFRPRSPYTVSEIRVAFLVWFAGKAPGENLITLTTYLAPNWPETTGLLFCFLEHEKIPAECAIEQIMSLQSVGYSVRIEVPASIVML